VRKWVPVLDDTWSAAISQLTVLVRYSVAVVIPAFSVSRKAWAMTCKTSCGVQPYAGDPIALHLQSQCLEWPPRYRCASAIPLFSRAPPALLPSQCISAGALKSVPVTLSVHLADIVIGR
jgi:hypothetical protein